MFAHLLEGLVSKSPLFYFLYVCLPVADSTYAMFICLLSLKKDCWINLLG